MLTQARWRISVRTVCGRVRRQTSGLGLPTDLGAGRRSHRRGGERGGRSTHKGGDAKGKWRWWW
ncbi:Uncharacterized protein M6B38_226045 [Iris pallida]|uniref:Uncharacterized protein n=1 Tax=Iris pallida TaxID=29817 RepID=A0AAX6DV56_IRIPA|nr:Uncharacterized protein M6B38_226045 [Iris pallida]